MFVELLELLLREQRPHPVTGVELRQAGGRIGVAPTEKEGQKQDGGGSASTHGDL
jgi:hypothetical protein